MDSTKENPEISFMQEATSRLERVNRDIESFLDRLPLKHHAEVARLRELIENQHRLSGHYPKSQLPPRVMVFFENARDKAATLRQRYEEAINNGTLRMVEEE